ncbi:MAG: hypothetical protein ABUL60_04620 [Myxococcales bacterium]
MTAIGAVQTAAERIAIVVGDLALEGVEPAVEVFVPTRGSTREVFPVGAGFTVVGLVQKVVICHDRLVVAWTGSRIAAQSLLRELTAISSPDDESLAAAVEGQEDSEATRQLEMLGFLAEPHDASTMRVRRFRVVGRNLSMSAGTTRFLGSGAPLLSEALERAFRSCVQLKGNSDAGALIMSSIFAAIGRLMSLELTTSVSRGEAVALHPLIHFFGGGYEIAVLDGRRFVKLDSAVHIFWRTRTVDGELRLEPWRILRPRYSGATLIVHAVNVQGPIEANAERVNEFETACS